jgi:hypothetical protein
MHKINFVSPASLRWMKLLVNPKTSCGMTKLSEIKIFEERKVRTLWDSEQEKWYFSIIDVIEILTGSPRPRKYWNALKTKLKAEGSELSQKLGQLKMQSADGKFDPMPFFNRNELNSEQEMN